MSLPAQPTALHARRCVRHSTREAAARCAGCGGFFCRECIAEHNHRLYCASCLTRITTPASHRETGYMCRLLARTRGALSLAAAALLLWAGFYYLGRTLVRIPHKFHDGTIWAESSDIDGNGDVGKGGQR
ncbi:rhomboid family protein [Opitutaceae bacterium TAV4]|nr:rhomboid family protein [Opitutaceae bacterium TAV4]RRJ98390.1 rhomboid family protein [Opitutaceae bacterium TAV3]